VLTLFIVIGLASLFGALMGRRLGAKDRKNIQIAILGNLLSAQKQLYVLNQVIDLQDRVKEMDEKAAPDQQELINTLLVTTKALERLVSE